MEQRKFKEWKPKPVSPVSPKYKAIRPVNAVLPSAVDLRPLCPPIFDQGQVGSCEGQSLSALFDFLQLQELKLKLPMAQAPEEFAAAGYVHSSPLFVYYNSRVIEGDPGQDAGVSTAVDGCESMIKLGMSSIKTWPYDESKVTVKPSPQAYAEAIHHKISGYTELESLNDMKHCLSQGFPFACGIAVFDSFMSDEVATTGIVPMPGPDEQLEGGHEITIVGYNDKTEQFILRNSWGTGWGLKGYCMIPYKYLLSTELASEFVTIRK